MQTPSAKPHEVTREWYIVDASEVNLGRMATRVATVLRGKHKVTYTPHVDTGDYVIVINAANAKFSGNKLDQKQYHSYSGYFGGLRSKTAREVLDTEPERAVVHAVKGMLPKNKLGRQMLTKLKVYPGAEHPHAGQTPKPFPANV